MIPCRTRFHTGQIGTALQSTDEGVGGGIRDSRLVVPMTAPREPELRRRESAKQLVTADETGQETPHDRRLTPVAKKRCFLLFFIRGSERKRRPARIELGERSGRNQTSVRPEPLGNGPIAAV